jgi:hemoglobin
LKYLFKEPIVTAAERRERITDEIVARTGITESLIERLVRAFYAKVRADAVLAPIFDARIADWEPHLERMCAFWSSVALMSGRYHGTPMAKHMPLPVDADHFDRWLALFEQTAREVCPPDAATHFVELARRIAASLELGIAGAQGVMLGNGERFRRQEAGDIR